MVVHGAFADGSGWLARTVVIRAPIRFAMWSSSTTFLTAGVWAFAEAAILAIAAALSIFPTAVMVTILSEPQLWQMSFQTSKILFLSDQSR